ncbi:MAG: phenylalanine--tRNA ligase subunit alpha [Planctomycetes bacterium]|nr:phenylalanine--tRNA ligase subunit alpha [Planctomycetota bacterium]
MALVDEARRLQEAFTTEVASATSAQALEELRGRYLGRQGLLRGLFDRIREVSPEGRREAGRSLNEVKAAITTALEERIAAPASGAEPETRPLDLTRPGVRPRLGHLHPLTQTIDEIVAIFGRLGFSLAHGPDVELTYYNFDALNTPLGYVSRSPSDTFYITDDVVLRTQTSPVQIRVMEKQAPPVQVISVGRCYRPDTVDATHCFMFYQVEGLMVDEDVTFADLKGVLTLFYREYLGRDVEVRLLPHFFPFTEPSGEVHMSCVFCHGPGCNVCKGTGWLEGAGFGMVDPNVLEAVGYDSERYTGFAFGLGIERMAMLRHGINDIRLFFESDVRFLEQF